MLYPRTFARINEMKFKQTQAYNCYFMMIKMGNLSYVSNKTIQTCSTYVLISASGSPASARAPFVSSLAAAPEDTILASAAGEQAFFPMPKKWRVI